MENKFLNPNILSYVYKHTKDEKLKSNTSASKQFR